MNLKTLRAYNIKLNLQEFYEISDEEAPLSHLNKWFFWATHSRLEPMKEALNVTGLESFNIPRLRLQMEY